MKTPDFEAIKTLDPTAVFSIAEAAQLLGLTHNGLRLRILGGKINAGKNGARYFIQGSDIQKQITLPMEM